LIFTDAVFGEGTNMKREGTLAKASLTRSWGRPSPILKRSGLRGEKQKGQKGGNRGGKQKSRLVLSRNEVLSVSRATARKKAAEEGAYARGADMVKRPRRMVEVDFKKGGEKGFPVRFILVDISRKREEG